MALGENPEIFATEHVQVWHNQLPKMHKDLQSMINRDLNPTFREA